MNARLHRIPLVAALAAFATLAALPAAAITRAPWSRAIWIAALPTPLPAACTSTRDPGRSSTCCVLPASSISRIDEWNASFFRAKNSALWSSSIIAGAPAP